MRRVATLLPAANTRVMPASVWLGVATLAIGYAYYAWLRPQWAANTAAAHNSLPTFIHVMAFSLLTSAASGAGTRGRVGICLAWIAINCAFEFGQQLGISHWLVVTIDDLCGTRFICSRTSQFFAHGTFDDVDLAAGVLGGALAVITLLSLERRKENWS